MSGPLEGLQVIDLSRVLAGPWVTQTLADLGATVIKVERPGVGDDTRSWGPPWHDTGTSALSAYFMSANRGKQSICIDLSKSAGQELVKSLCLDADVFVENFKVGDMAARGLGYDELSVLNPRLIYCSITGFGQTGPYKDRPGYDFMIQAMSGLMSITGEPDERSTDGPQKVGVALADIITGLYSCIAVLAALSERNESGRGQHIDMALLDSMAAGLANQAANYLVSREAPGRLGNAHPNIVPYQAFPTLDGHLILAVGNNNQFTRLCEVLEIADVADDSRFADNENRVRFRSELVMILADLFKRRTTDKWLAILQKAGVPSGPINDIQGMFSDPQVIHRNLNIEIDGMQLVASPIKFSRSTLVYEKAPPTLGQHSKSILQTELGLSDDEIERLVRAGIVS